MKLKPMPDHSYLVNQIHYSQETGVFTWKVRRKGRYQDESVGSLQKNGYLLITIDGVRYFAHRLAWYWVTGEDPACGIDHRDGAGTNNRFSNLRPGDQLLNVQNQRRPRSDNSSGYLGVSPLGKRFSAQIHHLGKKHHLGVFDTAIAAHDAYVTEKRRIHAGCTL